MDCSKAQELFTAVLDNDPDNETQARFHAHLAACEDCALEWQHFQATLRCLQALDFAPPADLLAGIHARLHRPNRFPRFWHWLKNANPTFSLPTAFATVTVAFACMLIYKNILTSEPADDLSSRPRTAGYQDRIPATSFGAGQETAAPRAFAFRQDLVQPATNSLDQAYGYGSAFRDGNRRNPKAVETPPDVFYGSYIHHYLKRPNTPAVGSDLAITLHPRDRQSVALLHRCLLAETKWHVRAHGLNRYLLTLDRQELVHLQKLLATHADAPPLPDKLLARIEAKTINVSINLK